MTFYCFVIGSSTRTRRPHAAGSSGPQSMLRESRAVFVLISGRPPYYRTPQVFTHYRRRGGDGVYTLPAFYCAAGGLRRWKPRVFYAYANWTQCKHNKNDEPTFGPHVCRTAGETRVPRGAQHALVKIPGNQLPTTTTTCHTRRNHRGRGIRGGRGEPVAAATPS